MTSANDLIAGLPGLLDELRLAGYLIGVEQYLAAHELVLALAGRDALPDDPRRLGPLLGPLLCKSLPQQKEFPERFERWFSRGAGTAAADAPAGLGTELIAIERNSREWRRAMWLLAAATAVVLGGLFWAAVARRPATASRPVPAPAAPSRFSDGVPTHRPVPPVNPVTQNEALVDREALPNEGTPALEKPSTPPADAGWTRPLRFAFAFAAAIAPMALALAAWRAWWAYRIRRFLVRVTTTETPEIERVTVGGVGNDLFRMPSVRQSARVLRRRTAVDSTALDVTATVAGTVRRAGYFAPVPERRRVIPEYLILIDRAGYRDHQAGLADALVDRLALEDVFVTRFEFEEDPRLVRGGRAGGEVLSLRELAARYPRHRLIVFSDGSGVIDPLTGEVAGWTEPFATWPERGMLTPEPVGRWGYRELALDRSGFLVETSDEEGLAALAARWSAERPAPGVRTILPPYPELLREGSRRWIDRHEPEPGVPEELLARLRDYLGEAGFLWLAACAIYPSVHWPLTIHLGAVLMTPEGERLVDTGALASLVRLPWFRFGTIPDWLRSRLASSLTAEQDRAVRSALQALFLSALGGPSGGFDLEVARGHRAPLGALAARVFRTLRRRAPEESPLRDHVFAAAMSGRVTNRLAVDLPRAVAKALGRDSRPSRSPEIKRGEPLTAVRRPAESAAPVKAASTYSPPPTPTPGPGEWGVRAAVAGIAVTAYPLGGVSEDQIRLRLHGLQYDVERSATLVRRLGLLVVLQIILLLVLLISIHIYHVMQYARVASVAAVAVDGRPETAEISYTPESAGKIAFVRESEGLVQTLTEYAKTPSSDEKSKGMFTWAVKKGERSTLHVTYRDGFFLVTKDLPVTPRDRKSPARGFE